MQFGYFRSAWGDIKNSPGWFGKMLLLALIMIIPVFGPIVVYGYLYGWARDIAWGLHSPMPKSIFGNEDGKLYTRGFFILVVMVVFSLVPFILEMIQAAAFGGGALSMLYGANSIQDMNWGGLLAFTGIFGGIFSLVVFAISIAVYFFEYVAMMRVSIYGTISAGFQLKQIWKMIKHDFTGLLKIFGMTLLIGFIVGIILSIVISIVVFIFIFAVAGTAAGSSLSSGSFDGSMVGAILALGGVGIFVTLIIGYVFAVILMWVQTLVARALGYWTRQFDVPNWKGQNDPLPFEVQQQPSYQTPPTTPMS